MDKRTAGKLKLIGSMLIWGSLGLFIRGIDLPSSVIANFRGLLGATFLLLVMLLGKLPFNRRAVKENALYLAMSGLMLGFNWILLFESYRYTTIAVATLCYYLAPIIVVATLGIGTAIVSEATLSFMGLGVQPPIPSWGYALSFGLRYMRTAPHMATIPGIAIMFTVLGFNLLGNGIRDVTDPRMVN